tara:strand:+ start:220 stop:591 length:372 start_codon:yes stop_codon:yes gene_type:complete
MRQKWGQEQFEAHCVKELGRDFGRVLRLAQAKYQEVYDNHAVEHQRHNRAMAALNLVFLQELKAIGAEEWRPRAGEEKPPARKVVAYRKPTQDEIAAVGYQAKKPKGTGLLNKMLDEIDASRK